jgi:uncharacterized membrane protein YeaQ/YmgE (transglycosylase-associated protein family)
MFFNVLIWIIFGILAGLLVNFIYPMEGKYLPGTIGAGIVGAFVGGILYSGLQIGQIAFELDPIATLIALIGAILLVYFIRALIRFDEKKS